MPIIAPVEGDFSPLVAGSRTALAEVERDAKKAGDAYATAAKRGASEGLAAFTREMDARIAKDRSVQDQLLRNRQAHFDAEAKAAAKAADAIERSMKGAADGTDQAFGNLKRGASSIFGGAVNDIEDLAAAAGELGPAGVGVLAFAGAFVAVGTAAATATALLYEAALSTGELDGANRGLANALGSVEQQIGTAVAPTFEGLTILVVAGVLAVGDLTTAIIKQASSLQEWFGGLSSTSQALVGAIPVFGALLNVVDKSTKVTEGAADANGTYGERAKALIGSLAAVQDVEDGAAGATKRHADAMREAEKAAKDLEAAQGSLRKVIADATADELTAEDKVLIAYQAREDAIDKAIAGGVALGDANEARAENDARLARDWADLQIEASNKVAIEEAKAFEDQERFDALHAANTKKLADKEAADEKKAAADAKKLLDMKIEASLSWASQVVDITDGVAQRALDSAYAERDARVEAMKATVAAQKGLSKEAGDAMIADAEKLTDAERKAALSAYAIQKAGALTQIAIDTASAVMSTLGQFGATPWGIAASGVAVTLGAVNAGIVAAQPPPAIAHTGLEIGRPGPLSSNRANQPDEQILRVRRGESASVEPRGAQQNQEPPRVVLRYNSRYYEDTSRDSIRRASDPTRQAIMRSSGRTPGHRR
jgi:hypothetical protein